MKKYFLWLLSLFNLSKPLALPPARDYRNDPILKKLADEDMKNGLY